VLFTNKHVGRQPTQPDWGQQMAKLVELITTAKNLNINFLCIAHEQYRKDEISNHAWCLPLVTGKLADRLSLYFDEVYHSFIRQEGKNKLYLLRTKGTGLITAKSRLDFKEEIPSDAEILIKEFEKLHNIKTKEEENKNEKQLQLANNIQPRGNQNNQINK